MLAQYLNVESLSFIFRVKPPRGMKVVQTNAQGKPKFFGLIGGYTWQIKKPDDAPFIVLKP